MLERAVEGEFQGIAPKGMVLAPRIQGLAEDADRAYSAALDAEEMGDFQGQIGLARGDGHGELPDT